jgi:DNA polymerase family A
MSAEAQQFSLDLAPTCRLREDRQAPVRATLGSEPSPPRGTIIDRIITLASKGPLLDDAERGELDTLLGVHLNTNSPKLLDFLYGEPPAGCGFPKRYIKDGTRNTSRLARSIAAMLANYRLSKDRRLELCLLLSDRLTQLETLRSKLDEDGRIRFSINVAGTKVGRMSCAKSNTGSGYNLHGVQDRHRQLFKADPGNDFWSVDLKGADGWTIGAECAALGDPRMLDDLMAGFKPANAVVLLYRHGAVVNEWSMVECLVAQSALDKSDWAYKACKIGIWGTCYGLGEIKLAEDILERSWKSGQGIVNVSAADCRKLQGLMHSRYPGINRRIERVKMLLARDGSLSAASGLTRDFFGRKDDHQTIKDALPFTPAANTAHANNLALLKLWGDPERRDRKVRPILTVHDSVLFQAPTENREWVAQRIPVWWDNPLTVDGTTFTIPYEALVGTSWGNLKPL